MIAPVLVLGLIASFAEAPQATASPFAMQAGRAYKVAFWYEADRPTTTLKYQVYDLARGEYDEKAVDRWFYSILNNDPDHGAYIRDIRTDGFPGSTEQERLANAIETEKWRWAALHRKISAPIPKLIEAPQVYTRTSSYQLSPSSPGSFSSPGGPGSPGVSGGYANLPSSPFPYPYRSGPR